MTKNKRMRQINLMMMIDKRMGIGYSVTLLDKGLVFCIQHTHTHMHMHMHTHTHTRTLTYTTVPAQFFFKNICAFHKFFNRKAINEKINETDNKATTWVEEKTRSLQEMTYCHD